MVGNFTPDEKQSGSIPLVSLFIWLKEKVLENYYFLLVFNF